MVQAELGVQQLCATALPSPLVSDSPATHSPDCAIPLI